MKKFLLLLLVFISTLYANKVVYLQYEDIPKRVIKGEQFHITLKALSTIPDANISYEVSNGLGLKFITHLPQNKKLGKYSLEDFYFVATDNKIKLPDITATISLEQNSSKMDTNRSYDINSTFEDIDTQENNTTLNDYESTILKGKKLKVIELNPKNNYANILADSFELINYKTTNYDTQHNIVIFVAKASNSDLSNIKLQNVYKQGVESIDQNISETKFTYFCVINKNIEEFSFSYFNVLQNRFIDINIPIVVDDDSVTTQSDLKPKDQSKDKIKMVVALGVTVFFTTLAIFRKKSIYIFLALLPLIYAIYLAIPSQKVCIKKGANIYLLPMKNGTVFETTATKYTLQKEGSIKNYTKVKLQNNKIGWVKNEDLCSH